MTDERKTEETRESPDAVRDDPNAIAISQAEAETPVRAHEQSDLGIRIVGIFILIVAGLVVLGLLSSGGLLNAFSRAEGSEQPGSPIEMTAPPESVRLQIEPQSAMEHYRATAQAQLEGYSWVDQEGGFARIPITRAMTLITQGVLPAPAEAQPPPGGEEMPTPTVTPES
jgi:hypothetical protein